MAYVAGYGKPYDRRHMTEVEFERLRAAAAVYGNTLGVSATLRIVHTGRPPFSPRRPRIMLRVVRC